MERLHIDHYVPILRWKKAEQTALAQLSEDVAQRVTPIIEITKDNLRRSNEGKVELAAVAQEIAGDVFGHWGERPIYIDLHHLADDANASGSNDLLNILGATSQTKMIPVICLYPSPSFIEAIRRVLRLHKEGMCLRLFPVDLDRNNIAQDIMNLL